MDSISALMSPATDEEELQALADSLRGRKRAADFFSLSTIAPLQQMAQGQQREVQDAAKGQGVLRRAMADRNQRAEQAELSRELEKQRIEQANVRNALAQSQFDYDQVQDLRSDTKKLRGDILDSLGDRSMEGAQ